MIVACKQALWGTLTAEGGKRKESLELHLWNLNISIEKVYVKCWLLEMTLVMMSSSLIGLCFSMNLCLHLRSFLLRADWWKSHSSVNGEPQEIWGWNSSCKLSFLFLPCCQCTWRACSQTIVIVSRETTSKFEGNLSKLENYNTLWVYYNKLYLMNNLSIFLLQPWNRKNSLGSPRHDQFIGRNRY